MPDVLELWVDENESGKISFVFDLSDDPELKNQIGVIPSLLGGETENPKNILDNRNVLDTTYSFFDLEPAISRDTLPDVDLLKQYFLRFQANKKEETAAISFFAEFNNKEHLKQLSNHIKKKLNEEDKKQFIVDIDCIDFKFHPLTDHISVTAKDYMQLVGNTQFIEVQYMMDSLTTVLDSLKSIPDSLTTAESEMQGAMVEMGLSEMKNQADALLGGDIELILNLPRKIMFTNEKDAKINKQQFRYKMKKRDLIKQGKSKEFIIKFDN